jgi:hypothetical protein
MISAAKLHKLSNINADRLVELLLDAGYDTSDEPIINTHFDGVATSGETLNFAYQAQYVRADGSLQFADIIVSFDPATSAVSAEFAA